MSWHEFLRLERARKLALLEQLSSGCGDIPAGHQDTYQQLIVEHRQHIVELDRLLSRKPAPAALLK